MRISTWVLPLLLGLLVVGCGGGGGGSSAPATGFVTVLVGDKPIDDLRAVWLTVREIEFNMTGGKKHVFVGMDEPINLMELTNLTEALMINEEIVTGKGTKIRLLLDDLAIERKESPEDAEPEMVPVPAGGWIELNPQGPFEVRAGQTIYVMIDFLLDDSLVHVVETDTDEYRFRPQVFAEIKAEGDESRLVRLKGTARGVNPNDDTFELCDLRREAGNGSSNNLYDCVIIKMDNTVDGEDTLLIENGSLLVENAIVTAFGFMDFDPDPSKDTMNAEVLVAGMVEPIIAESGIATLVPPNLQIDQSAAGGPAQFDINPTAAGWKNFPGVTENPETTGEVMVMDDIEAFGFAIEPATTPPSMEAFLFIYKRPQIPPP